MEFWLKPLDWLDRLLYNYGNYVEIFCIIVAAMVCISAVYFFIGWIGISIAVAVTLFFIVYDIIDNYRG